MLKYLSITSTGGALVWYADFKLPYGHYGRKNNIEIIAQSNSLNNQIRPTIEASLREYTPSWFYLHQALTIAYSCIVPAPHIIEYERVRQVARTPTAGILTYDLVRAKTPTKKALLVIPGVCGSSSEAYV